MNNKLFIQNYANIFETSDVLNMFEPSTVLISQSVQNIQLPIPEPKKKVKHEPKNKYKTKSKNNEVVQFKSRDENSIFLIQQNLKFIKILSNIRKLLHPNERPRRRRQDKKDRGRRSR